MKKLLLLLPLLFLFCESPSEIFPNQEVISEDRDIILETITQSDTIPLSIKVNYSKDFQYYIKSFKNSTHSFDGVFNSSNVIDVANVYDTVILNNDSLIVAVRQDTSEYITRVVDSIYTTENSKTLGLSSIYKVVTLITSIDNSIVSTTVKGDSALLSHSTDLYVTHKTKFSWGDIDYVVAVVTKNGLDFSALTEAVENPKRVQFYSLDKDSTIEYVTTVTEKEFEAFTPAIDTVHDGDSTLHIYTNCSNFFVDSSVVIDSIRVIKDGEYNYLAKNIVKDSPINFEDSIMIEVNWNFDKGGSLYETVVQLDEVWTLDSIYKEVSANHTYEMKRFDDEYVDTVYLYSEYNGVHMYEYYSKKWGSFKGVATKVLRDDGFTDSLFIGNRSIYRDITKSGDTTNVFMNHDRFESFSGIYTRIDKSFFIFDVDEDGEIVKK